MSAVSLENERENYRHRAMTELLYACRSNTLQRQLQVKFTIDVSDPRQFIGRSVRRSLELIEGCKEYQNGPSLHSNSDEYWTDILEEEAGLELVCFD